MTGLLLWFIGCLFTVALHDTLKPNRKTKIRAKEDLVCFFIWPVVLGIIVGDVVKRYWKDTNHK